MPFETKPLRRYKAPKYPHFGFEIPQVENQSFWFRLPKTKIVAAVISGALPLGGCLWNLPFGGETQLAGDMVGPEVQATLTEAEVRQAVTEHFAAAGLTVTEDFSFDDAGVAFVADGYDETSKVGYEYLSEGDTDTEAVNAGRGQLADWSAAGGPHFLVLDYENYIYYCYDEACTDDTVRRDFMLDSLKNEVDGFLEQLRGQGVI